MLVKARVVVISLAVLAIVAANPLANTAAGKMKAAPQAKSTILSSKDEVDAFLAQNPYNLLGHFSTSNEVWKLYCKRQWKERTF